MKPEEEFHVGEAVSQLALIYGAVNTSAEAKMLWVGLLNDLPLDSVLEAFKRFAKGTDDFPTPGKIRKIAKDLAYDRRIAAQNEKIIEANRQRQGATPVNLCLPVMNSGKPVAESVKPHRPKLTEAELAAAHEARRQQCIADLKRWSEENKNAK